jgi:hypothetical protein
VARGDLEEAALDMDYYGAVGHRRIGSETAVSVPEEIGVRAEAGEDRCSDQEI